MAKSVWTVDVSHSTVEFMVRHMMIAKVKGLFHTFEASIEADAHDLTTADIAFTIDLNSVDTRNQDRDNHLRSAEFFEIEKFPNLTFKATSIKQTSDGEYDITGEVTMHGVTRTETFQATFEGVNKDPWGNQKVGYSVTGLLKRSEYGLTYNAALEAGGVLISDDVKITLEIEATYEA